MARAQELGERDYVMSYHCLNETESYAIGFSFASDPLGPWSEPAPRPVLSVDAGAWDQDSVASFNMMANPSPKAADGADAWLGWYEGGTGPGSDGVWTVGHATAPSARGPWTKYAKNPILKGSKACEKKYTKAHAFHGICNGMYVGSVLWDEERTNGEFWMYLEAPINMNDEGRVT